MAFHNLVSTLLIFGLLKTAFGDAFPSDFAGGSSIHVREQDIFSELASRLSLGASVITTSDPLMQKHQRWQAYSSPTYTVVVEVSVEEDVQEIVGPQHLPLAQSFPLTCNCALLTSILGPFR